LAGEEGLPSRVRPDEEEGVRGGPLVALLSDKTGGIDYGELELELFLFELSLDDLNFGELVELLVI
jgi:hypothetical protein